MTFDRVDLGENVALYRGDCLEVLATLEAGMADAIIADLPYGTTACKWDTVIPFAPLWSGYKHILKSRGAVVLFGSQPFTSALVMSNVGWFKWEDIWHKTQATGHLNARVMPLREHENILIFGNGRITYNPQMSPKLPKNVRPTIRGGQPECYGDSDPAAPRTISPYMSFPRSVIRIPNANGKEKGPHPTQKPVALLEYLIRTYTNEGETVVDNTMGSGTTGVACVKTNRRFVGMELDQGYFDIARARIQAAMDEMVQDRLV